jgi:hypothetical protein
MIYQMQDLLAEAIANSVVSPAVLASNVRLDRGWKGEHIRYYVIAKGTPVGFLSRPVSHGVHRACISHATCLYRWHLCHTI